MPQTVRILVTIPINPAPAPSKFVGPTAATIPAATVDQPYTAEVAQVSGGIPPYNQPTIASDSQNPLPKGLSASIDSDGIITISGTPVLPTGPKGVQVLLDVADSTKN